MSFRLRPDRHVRPGAPGAGAARRWERAEMTPDRDRWMRRCSTYTHSAWTCTARTPSPPLGRSGVAICCRLCCRLSPTLSGIAKGGEKPGDGAEMDRQAHGSLFLDVVGNRADLEFPVCPLSGRLDPVRAAKGADSDAIDLAVTGDGRGPGHAAATFGVLLRPVT